MVDDTDIWRSASQLLKQHGADALIEASLRCDQLMDRGDLTGAAVWRQITNAIIWLEREEAPKGAPVN